MRGLELFVDAVTLVELVVCVAASTLLAARWSSRRAPATGAAFGLFTVVALVLTGGRLLGDAPPQDAGDALLADLLICVLLAVPWLLVAFAVALGSLPQRVLHVATAVLAVESALTLALPPLPQDGEPRPGWALAYIGGALTAWAVQSLLAAVALWRSGHGQSAVVRHRMRLLSTGGVLLAVTLVVSGTVGGQSAAAQVAVTLLGLGSILLFALAFLLPGWLRLVLRQGDLSTLAAGERRLMEAVRREDVTLAVVPLLAQVFGGGAGVFGHDGRTDHTSGWGSGQQGAVGRQLVVLPPGPVLQELQPGLLAVRLSQDWLVVQAGLLAPVFGDDEAALLGRVGTLVDLALQRVELFEQERSSRVAAEAAQAELQTLLYSVSHDLRSPLISVLGYLDVLRSEHHDEVQAEGRHYLERISVNALYMQSLICDLLELSRIGRSEAPPRVVDLQALAEDVFQAARMSHPRARLTVPEPLPPLLLSDVRVRQLLTNLVENALVHGGRDDLALTVEATASETGELVLSVSDDGRGIPEEYRSRVLQVFERLDAPKSTPGTGMGLAICKRIAETAGGSLRVEGPAPGLPSGTTVVVTLPPGVLVASRSVPVQRGPAAHAAVESEETA